MNKLRRSGRRRHTKFKKNPPQDYKKSGPKKISKKKEVETVMTDVTLLALIDHVGILTVDHLEQKGFTYPTKCEAPFRYKKRKKKKCVRMLVSLVWLKVMIWLYLIFLTAAHLFLIFDAICCSITQTCHKALFFGTGLYARTPSY